MTDPSPTPAETAALRELGTVLAQLQPGTINAARLRPLVQVTLPHWRRQPERPHQGAIVIATRDGPFPVRGKRLLRFYGVGAEGPDVERETVANIRCFLRVFGAAHLAAQGEAEGIVDRLRALLDGEGEAAAATAPRMLRKAQRPDGPAWAAPLRRPRPSPEERAARRLADFRQALALYRRPVPPDTPKRIQRRVALLEHFTADDWRTIKGYLSAAEERLGQREAEAARARDAARSRPRVN